MFDGFKTEVNKRKYCTLHLTPEVVVHHNFLIKNRTFLLTKIVNVCNLMEGLVLNG
jgi:hypothetical protein